MSPSREQQRQEYRFGEVSEVHLAWFSRFGCGLAAGLRDWGTQQARRWLLCHRSGQRLKCGSATIGGRVEQGGGGDIRRRMVEGDLVECMVALPPQLFFNTQIPACLWFLSRDKSSSRGRADRRGQVLFIDARELGQLETRVFRVFGTEKIDRIAQTFHAWRGDEGASGYEDVPGFCKSATLKEIEEHGFILTPGRYVGAQAVEEDEEAFGEKMQVLAATLREQFTQSDMLEAEIKRNLEMLGL